MTDAHQALQAPGYGVEEMPNINGITLSDVIVALEKLSPVIFARAEAMKAKRPILSGGL